MHTTLKLGYKSELALAQTAYKKADWAQAFRHLERAHILGQRYLIPHLHVHFLMLKFGIRHRNIREILGQILRMLAVFPAAIFGWVPEGNTGGANISALKPMPIPDDLKALLEP